MRDVAEVSRLLFDRREHDRTYFDWRAVGIFTWLDVSRALRDQAMSELHFPMTTACATAEAESVAFLRRFADVMSGGTNAARLTQAADAIENLCERLAGALDLARQEAELRATYQDLCEVAESAAGQLTSEIANLKQQLVVQQEQQQLMQARLVEVNRDLLDRLSQSEAELRARGSDLSAVQAEIEYLKNSKLAATQEIMRAARDQFQSLADECERRGDMVLTVMCEVGKSLIDQTMAAEAK